MAVAGYMALGANSFRTSMAVSSDPLERSLLSLLLGSSSPVRSQSSMKWLQGHPLQIGIAFFFEAAPQSDGETSRLSEWQPFSMPNQGRNTVGN